MGAPVGNCNACKGGLHQRGKKSGFRSAGKKRYNLKLHQHNKKSGLRTRRFTDSTGHHIITYSTKRTNIPGRSTH